VTTVSVCPTGTKAGKSLIRCPECNAREYLPCRPDEASPRVILRCLDCGYEGPEASLPEITPSRNRTGNTATDRDLGLSTPEPLMPVQKPARREAEPTKRVTERVTEPVKRETEPATRLTESSESLNTESKTVTRKEKTMKTLGPDLTKRNKHDQKKYIDANLREILNDAQTIGVLPTKAKWGIADNTIYKYLKAANLEPGTARRVVKRDPSVQRPGDKPFPKLGAFPGKPLEVVRPQTANPRPEPAQTGLPPFPPFEDAVRAGCAEAWLLAWAAVAK
jgi:hypothetical protein